MLVCKAEHEDKPVVEWLPSEAEAKRRIAEYKARFEDADIPILKSRQDFFVAGGSYHTFAIAYNLVDPETWQRRYKGELLPGPLKEEFRPEL